jgi:hypothetical protein
MREALIASKSAFKWDVPALLQKRHSLISLKKLGLTFMGGLRLGPLSLFQISCSSPRPASAALIMSESGSERLNSRAARSEFGPRGMGSFRAYRFRTAAGMVSAGHSVLLEFSPCIR